MENSNSSSAIEEFEDALSLCDFALYDQETDEESNNSPCQEEEEEEDFFGFSTSLSSSSEVKDNIIFCGKIISCKTEDGDHHHHHQRNNNPLLTPSSPSPRLLSKNRISSNNYSSSKPAALPPQTRSSSKKHKAIIGLTKIPSKMELSDLRERQNRKLQTAPPPMFPAVVSGESSAVSGNGSSKKSHNWSILRPFRFRAQDLASMLTRSSSSLGCLRLARPALH